MSRFSLWLVKVELEFCEWLKQQFGLHSALQVGIGDDAAVFSRSLSSTSGNWVVTNDVLLDRVHFLSDEHLPESIGHKAIAVNLSDLAAMGADPVAVLVGVAVPRSIAASPAPLEFMKRIYTGMRPLMSQFDVALAGGDTNIWNGPLSISVTAMGASVEPPLTRSNAQVGDQLLVTGPLGGSILGHHLSFTPRVAEARRLRELCVIHAAIDISDGLLLDASRLAAASGVGIELDFDAIPVSDAARRLAESTANQQSALQHALSDGEDFELLIAVSTDTLNKLNAETSLGFPLYNIGRCIEQRGLFRRQPGGSPTQIEAKGYEHKL